MVARSQVTGTPVLDGIPITVPDEGAFMDPRGYSSPAFYDLEMRAVFPRCWVFMGSVHDALKTNGMLLTEAALGAGALILFAAVASRIPGADRAH